MVETRLHNSDDAIVWYRVDRVPVKARPRMSRYGHVYTDKKTREDEAAVAAAYKGEKHACPVSILVKVHGALSKADKKRASVDFVIEPKRPDIDNILKAVMDGLNGVAYEDDRQVVHAVIYKLKPVDGLEPFIEYAVNAQPEWSTYDEQH